MNYLEKYIEERFATMINEIKKRDNQYAIDPQTGDLLIYSNNPEKESMSAYRYEPSTGRWSPPALIFTTKDIGKFLDQYVNSAIPEKSKKKEKTWGVIGNSEHIDMKAE
jgi:hypothetical protein